MLHKICYKTKITFKLIIFYALKVITISLWWIYYMINYMSHVGSWKWAMV